DVRDHAGEVEQLLARLLAAASGTVTHAWLAGRCDREGHQRFCGGEPDSRTPHPQLRRLAAGKLWTDVRPTLSDAVHAEIPPDQRRQHEHRLVGATHLPAKPRGGVTRCDLAVCANDSLHYP